MKHIKSTLNNFVDKLKPETFFAFTACVFGLLFLAITPPFQTPDEVIHFYRSYQISTPNLTLDDSKVPIPKSIQYTVDTVFRDSQVRFDGSKKYDGNKTLEALKIDLKESEVDKANNFNLALGTSYGPLSYAPQSVGILIGKILDISPVGLIYIGKLANLITWIALFTLAIKLIPRKKWAVVFIGLLPMGLFQAVSLGADTLMIGLATLFVSMILYFREKQTVLSYKELAVLLLIGSIMVLTKQNMFLFLPLILILPTRIFSSARFSYFAKVLLILIPFMLVIMWALTAGNGSGNAIEPTSNNQNATAQAKFVIKNPHSFANVLWNTHFYTWGDGITRSFIGNFGWVDTPLSEMIVVVGYIGLFVIIIANTRNKINSWLTTREKLLVLGVIAAFWLSINAALYLYYSPVGYKIIVGLQGRYFLPLLILLIPLTYSNWLRISKTAYRRVATYVPIFLLCCSVITIYVRYYINNV